MAKVDVRPARSPEAAFVAALSERVQAWLTASGSLQQIGPLDPTVVASGIEQGTVFVLITDQLAGSVFVEPVREAARQAVTFAHWQFNPTDYHYYFLSKLMIEPARQGQQLGQSFVEEIKKIVATDPKACLVLDCWAGNTKLRQFYIGLGFELHGIFPEDDFEVAVFKWLPSSNS